MIPQIIVISSPVQVPSEIRRLVALFELGLQQFHVRKPGFTDFDMINYIGSIPKAYRKFLVLHSHYHLAKELGLKGIQVGKNRVTEGEIYRNDFSYYGYSAHSINEVLELKNHPDSHRYTHFFLSPVYNSISKEGYESGFSLGELSGFIAQNPDLKLIALGGINADNCKRTLNLGFHSVAVLGSIWQTEGSAKAFNEIQDSLVQRPFALSIAGFDPTSGAGVTADIKSFEQNKVQGLGVNTAITYQNENDFLDVDWLSFEQIKKQIDVLFLKYSPEFVKIGLIENFKVLRQIIDLLKSYNKSIKIIWDPVISASANFDFHKTINSKEVYSILKDIYLLTPNIPECEALFKTIDFIEIQKIVKEHNICNVLVKGGHPSNHKKGTDVLIEADNISYFEGEKLKYKTKHGTGCVLSAVICSNLTKGKNLSDSILSAKLYVASFIDSNSGLLGFHNITDC